MKSEAYLIIGGLIDFLTNTFGTLTSWQLFFLLLTLPTITVLLIFGWMLLASAKKDHASMKVSIFGLSVDFSATRYRPHGH